MTAPRVTVVIPVYNGEWFLWEARDGIFAQVLQDFEVICVDDGSTDGSMTVIDDYGQRVTRIRQPNAWQNAARNPGVERTLIRN